MTSALGFRGRLLIGAVLPALLMVTVLEFVFLSRYRVDTERAFIDRGKAIAHQLGVATEFALFSGSFATVDMLAEGVRQSDSDIVAVSVLDRNGHRIAGAGGKPQRGLSLQNSLQVMHDTTHVLIQAPIQPTTLALDTEPWSSNHPPSAGPVGYVLIEISRNQLDARHAEMLRITVSILLGGLLLAGWISARIAHDVMSKLDMASRELQRQKETADRLARTDALTGLANRRSFDEVVQQEIRRAVRYASPLSLVLTDIDHFKAVNDTHGHHVGDQVLIAFARALQEAVRDVDLVGRWGGEEFVILMPGTALEEAERAAERMRLAVAGAPVRVDGKALGYTASFGVATVAATRPTLDALLGGADAALYRAKAGGRNRVEASR